MPKQKGGLFLFVLACLSCAALIASCGAQQGSGRDSGAPNSGNAGANLTPTNAVSLVSAPTTSVATTCPAQGKVKAAIMPSLQRGGRQQIVYYHNIDDQMTLNLFDVQRKAATSLIGQNEHIQSAQLSVDGSWILLVVSGNGISALQLVRVDGKYFQTLYCAPAGKQIGTDAQWSLDQQQIIFSQSAGSDPGPLYMISLAGGSVRTELSASSPGFSLKALTWLDNTRVYVSVQSSSLYLLDTSKGAGQQIDNIKLVRNIGYTGWDFDCSGDATTLFFSGSPPVQSSTATQSPLMTASADGNGFQRITLKRNLAIVGVRVIDASHLMLASYAQEGSQAANNGFWKVANDGSGLTRLSSRLQMGTPPDSWGPFNPFTQYVWSNFSRDDTMYADGLFYGSLNGGSLTRYAADDEGDGDVLVGWTTL